MAKVLLVEDSATQATEMTMLLKEAAHEVVHVENGRKGLDVLQGQSIDVVITDLEMPEVNGLQLVEAMSLDFPHIPAILVTGRGSEDLAAEALQKGAAGYVPKSRMRELLGATITDVLGVIRSDESYANLIRTLRKNVFVFDLPNDTELIAPLTGLLTQVVSGMDLLGGTKLVQMAVAVEHALLNAMYRGNLELGPHETPPHRAILNDDATTALIERRKGESPYKDRRVHVEVTADQHEVRVDIRDDGNGFDTSHLPASGDPDLLDSEHGRGLVLMSSFADRLIFNDRGNEVTLIKYCRREV